LYLENSSDGYREKQISWDEAVLDKTQFMQKAMSVEWKQHEEKITEKKGEFFWRQSYNPHLHREEGDSQLV